MAIIKIPPGKTVNVEKVYVTVTCPNCNNTFNMKMKGPITRKGCQGCTTITFVFNIIPLRGSINVHAVAVSVYQEVTELNISPNDVEVDYDG